MNFPANEFGDLETGIHKGMISVSVGARTYRMQIQVRVKDGALENIIVENKGERDVFMCIGNPNEPY